MAGQAATALGVDAVIFVTFDSLRYEATDHAEAGNLGPTGKAKAVGSEAHGAFIGYAAMGLACLAGAS